MFSFDLRLAQSKCRPVLTKVSLTHSHSATADYRRYAYQVEREKGVFAANETLATSTSGAHPPPIHLHLQTDFSSSSVQSGQTLDLVNLTPQPSIGETLRPSHLQLHQFGSRFLPHATSPIRCLLPLLGDRLMLIGHDDGLSVMDMYPREWNDYGLVRKGPSDAEARPIWVGEG